MTLCVKLYKIYRYLLNAFNIFSFFNEKCYGILVIYISIIWSEFNEKDKIDI